MSILEQKFEFYKAPRSILKIPGLNCTDAVVMGILWFNSRLHQNVYSKLLNKRISEEAGVSIDTIKDSLKRLEDHGFIIRGGRGFKRKIWMNHELEESNPAGEQLRIAQ